MSRSSDMALSGAALRFVAGNDLDDALRQRFTGWLRDLYGGSAKLIAREFRVSPAAVQNWKQGVMPSPKTRLEIVLQFGAAFLSQVVDPNDRSLRVQALEHRIAELRRDLADHEKTLRQLRCTEHAKNSGNASLTSGAGCLSGRLPARSFT